MARNPKYWIAGLGWLVAGALALMLIVTHKPQRKEITIGAVRQDAVHEPLPITMTNQPLVLLQAVNEYRTSPGWIVASNDRIYAGLADRAWSASYTVPTYRHTLSILGGMGVGVHYTYAIAGRYPVGGMILYSGGVKVFASAGYRW